MTVLTLKEAITKGKLTFKPWLTKFSPEIFEVDFSEIIRGRGNVDYLDPAKFYALTYLTERMKDVLELCLVRTSGQNNKGTIHLATGFGGGKSHLLALLYHTFTSKAIIDNKMLRKLEISDVPDVMVVAADGHDLSFPLIKTKVLGKYLCKTKEETKQALESEEKPVLILLDEFVVYLAKLSEEKQKKELATFHTFMSAVNATKNCILVITNPEGAAVYGREVQMLTTTLDKSSIITAASGMAEIMGRVTQPIVPVEQSDFISILKIRLIESIDPKVAKDAEKELGRRVGITKAGTYPFHPSLVEVLYNRISLFPSFQKTRDSLKVVALMIKGILKNRSDAEFYFLSPADLLFEDPDLKGILTNEKVFGVNLQSAVTQDVVKAARKGDSDKKFGKLGRLASAIFMYSLHPNISKRGAGPDDVFRCMTVVRSLQDMEGMLKEFYSNHSTFMWNEGGKYLFKSHQNIPNMIRLRANEVMPSQIKMYVEKTLFNTVFIKTSKANCKYDLPLPDIQNPKPNSLNVIVPLYYNGPTKVVANALSITGKRKNSVIVLIPDNTFQGSLEWYVKLTLGASEVKKDVKREKAQLQEAEALRTKYEAQAMQQFRSMYSKAKFLRGQKIIDCDLQTMGSGSLTDVLLSRLIEVQKIVSDKTDPKIFLGKLMGKRNHVQVRELFEDVEIMSSVPFATQFELKKIIGNGVYEGVVGLFQGRIPEHLTGNECVYYRVQVEVNDGDTLVTEEYAKKLKEEIRGLSVDADEGPISTESEGTDVQVLLDEPSPDEEIDSFEADADKLREELEKRITPLILDDVEVRADIQFTGSITGGLSAKNMRELKAIQELAEGFSKAKMILGGVQVQVTIYKIVPGEN